MARFPSAFVGALLGVMGCTQPRPLFDTGASGSDAGASELDAPGLDAPATDAPTLDAPALDAPATDAGLDAPRMEGRDSAVPDAFGFDAGTSAACDTQFGGVPGYVFCGSTATTCLFYADDTADCRETCMAAGGDCAMAFEATSPGSCFGARMVACGSNAGDLCNCTILP